ncbi:hypothetical protein CDAR_602311 [Caerostris darwini]|uniref:Uncharacterized protein n=1 Tax=Caerostris darwini TaxID=1538125 RepID=A0AAV4N951_9ARAC|nr:hypothetical protein CDAR_602311 [Caerostris darwini]
MCRSGTQRQNPSLSLKRIPSRGLGIHHNHDEIIRQSAYSSRFPKHPLPVCVARVSDWTAPRVNRAIGFRGRGSPKHLLPACVAGVSDWTARQVNRALGFGRGGRKGSLPLKGAADIAERAPARNSIGDYLSCLCVLCGV